MAPTRQPSAAAAQTEIELKLQVPISARPAVSKALQGPGTQRTRLQAVYFDTPDRRLAARGIAVRLRREGERWVQTCKAGDPHGMRRHEHNVPVPPPLDGTVPTLELSRHLGTAAGDLLAAALQGSPQSSPMPLYRTDIERTHRVVRAGTGRVELALDIGVIVSGEKVWPVHELEIEHVDGPTAVVIDTARRWVRRHGLWVDVRSKAERGDRLSRGEDTGKAVRVKSVDVRDASDAGDARRSTVQALLGQVLPNASEVATERGGDASDTPVGAGNADHVHRLRTGLRRLIVALRLYDGLAAGPDESVRDALDAARHDLGAARDREALVATLLPAFDAPGAPAVTRPLPSDAAASLAHAAAVAQRPALSLALLALRDAGPVATGDGTGAADWRVQIARRLRRWHRRVTRDARRFDELDATQQHRLRRRIKRLHDGLMLTGSLFHARALARTMARLRAAQDALGRAHDLLHAWETSRAWAASEPAAAYAAGWLSAERADVEADARKAVRRLLRSPFKPVRALRSR